MSRVVYYARKFEKGNLKPLLLARLEMSQSVKRYAPISLLAAWVDRLQREGEAELSAHAIVARDLQDIRDSDALLADFRGAGSFAPGMLVEIGMARALGKPVVILDPGDEDTRLLTDRVMVKGCGIVVESVDEAAQVLAAVTAGRDPYTTGGDLFGLCL